MDFQVLRCEVCVKETDQLFFPVPLVELLLRYHHHITVNGGIDRDTLESMWEYGYANSLDMR